MAKAEKKIEIVAPKWEMVTVTLDGDTPFLSNAFSEDTVQALEDKMTGKPTTGRDKLDVERKFKNSLYVYDKKSYGIKREALYLCAKQAAGKVKLRGVGGTFAIIGGNSEGLLRIDGAKPRMDRRAVKVGPFGARVATLAYRGRFDKWSVTFQIKYNAQMITAEQLVNLYETAGFCVGIGDYRPECDGEFGRFHVRRGKR